MEECFPNEIVQSCGEGDETEVANQNELKLNHTKKMKVDLTLERSSQLQSQFIQFHLMVHLLLYKAFVSGYTPCPVKVSSKQ